MKCQNTNPEGSAFCNKCGNPLNGINYRGEKVYANEQLQYKQQQQQNLIRSACGNCGHGLAAHTGNSTNSNKGTLPKGISNKNTACSQCACIVYKDRSKARTGSPVVTQESFFYYSQSPAYFVEEPASTESEDHDKSDTSHGQLQDNNPNTESNVDDSSASYVEGDYEF
jgi:hypothetical protein